MRYSKALITICCLIIATVFFANTNACAEGVPPTIKTKDGVKVKLIPAGTFMMGSAEPDIAPISTPHKIFVNAFYMDEHLVTNFQFARFLNEAAGKDGLVKDRKKWIVIREDMQDQERELWWPTEIGHERGKYFAYEGFENYPVITVSWLAADKYCKWAGKRLPTEAEWEKAARGKKKEARFVWGNSLPTEGVVFNRQWRTNEEPPPLSNVIYGMPNGYGLFNMAGMIWEWCADWFAHDYYESSPSKNPQGPESGEFKVLRGGSWFNAANVLRVGLRNFIAPDALDETTGFRCAMDIPAGGTDAK